MLYKLAMATVVVMGLSCVAPLLKAEEFQSDFSLIMHAIARDDLPAALNVLTKYNISNTALLLAEGFFNGGTYRVLSYIIASNRVEMLTAILALPNTKIQDIDGVMILREVLDFCGGHAGREHINEAMIAFIHSGCGFHRNMFSIFRDLLSHHKLLSELLDAGYPVIQVSPYDFSELVGHVSRSREQKEFESWGIILNQLKKHLSPYELNEYVCQAHFELQVRAYTEWRRRIAYYRAAHRLLDSVATREQCGTPYNMSPIKNWWHSICCDEVTFGRDCD